MTATRQGRTTKEEKATAVEQLRQSLPVGTTVYCVLRSVSRSGMSRHIDFYVMQDQAEPRWLSGYIGTALGLRRAAHDRGLVVSGCGMDMGFHVVYNLAYVLYPQGHECIGDGCPSNDHSNGDRNREPHQHRDGGYALRSRWL